MKQIALIKSLQKRAAKAGLSIAELCRRADIAPITWRRWRKAENGANYQKLEKVEKVISDAEAS